MPDRPRILVVEDDAIIQQDIEHTLLRQGYLVCGTAQSGSEAIAAAETLAPDLILMDVRLGAPPEGIEAAAVIRKRRDVPVVFLTAHSDEATLARAKQVSPQGYLLKPFDERELRVAVEVALYNHEQRRKDAAREKSQAASAQLASIGTVASGMAHEIRNPLAAVVANVALAAENLATVKDQLRKRGDGALADELREVLAMLADAGRAAARIEAVVAVVKVVATSDRPQSSALLQESAPEQASAGDKPAAAAAAPTATGAGLALVVGHAASLRAKVDRQSR